MINKFFLFKDFLIFLLFLHILGDYYFQTPLLSERKAKSYSAVLQHCLIYSIVCLLALIPVMDAQLLFAVIIAALSHLMIDNAKLCYIDYLKKNNQYTAVKERTIYIADQILHLLSLTLIAYVMVTEGANIQIAPFLSNILSTVFPSAKSAFIWMVMFLFIWKPANITIRYLLSIYKPSYKDGSDTGKAGSFIGLLERLLILILLSINQFSAIGLVLTAKSIARYDKISKDKEFAEYYLLGTLLSTIIVIVVYLFVA